MNAKRTKTIKFEAIEFATANDAFNYHHTRWTRDRRVIERNSRYYVITQAEADRLAAAGVEFAYLHIRDMPDGSQRLVAVQVN